MGERSNPFFYTRCSLSAGCRVRTNVRPTRYREFPAELCWFRPMALAKKKPAATSGASPLPIWIPHGTVRMAALLKLPRPMISHPM
jgi:hypothetical protein